MIDNLNDIIIVGAGAAGMTAALYSLRAGKKNNNDDKSIVTLLIEPFLDPKCKSENQSMGSAG